MKLIGKSCIILLLITIVGSCKQQVEQATAYEPMLRSTHHILNAAIIEDGFSPPVASRIYANAYLAGYECIALADDDYPDLSTTLNEFPPGLTDIDTSDPMYIPEVAALKAIMETAKEFVYRKFIIEEYEQKLIADLYASGNKAAIDHSLKIGDMIAGHIIQYAGTDNYKETRNMPFHNATDEWGTWEPTPPMYGTAIEPHWNKIRPFVLDSIDIFQTNYELNYDTARNSEFYREAMIVYDSVKALDEEKIAKANHWDCNPRETLTSGHMVTQIKQMNPGGHWLGIGLTVLKNEGADFRQTVHAIAYTAIAVADGFIVCWNEKYETNLIRPETYINRYIDPDWHPILETPLFPEYTSGHSVVSGIASAVLTEIVGDNIAYIDSVNFMFDLPPRSFKSFNNAAEEAAISRLYGGIHYVPAVKNGLDQGRSVASYVLDNLPSKP